MQRSLDELFARLAGSAFRRRFRLGKREREYLDRRGIETIMAHAADFIEERLAPADPPNDGKQTPMRNHPVFIAQHATAKCCRACLDKWHAIPRGRELSDEEKDYVLAVVRRWLVTQTSP